MRRSRNTKIVATLGPACSSPKMIESLFNAGVDVFRFNFSHGSYEVHTTNYETVRQIEKKTNRPIGTLLDLQGPKFRIGNFSYNSIELKVGKVFRLDLDPTQGDQSRVNLPHPEIFDALEIDAELLIDDGRLRLRVVEIKSNYAITEVKVGGTLSNNKGINIPGVVLPLSSLTEKDRRDLDYGLQLGVDWIALSFVQRPEDMQELRKIVDSRAKILAKIEKPAAIDRLEAIIAESDAIMVARGDLGIEIPPESVPSIQKRILRSCRKAGRPVIVATQMLDSMIKTPVPTRAEAADVATAVYDGADAVMLSGETAVGGYPIEAVSMMSSIIEQVEKDPHYRTILDAAHPAAEETTADAICCAMRRVAGLLSVSATVTFTSSGFSSLRAARERPAAPILSLSPNPSTVRYLTLVWGVHTINANAEPAMLGEMVQQACHFAVQENFTLPGKPIVLIGGIPFGKPGTTNLLHVAWPDEELVAER
jgi:pyruvate kinase